MDLGKSFKDLSDDVLSGDLKQGAYIAGSRIQSKARDLVPVDTGALRISIENSVGAQTRDIGVEVGPTQPYGKDIEFGRPPGTFVSAAALSGWAKRKGLNPYAVSWAIHKKGSPAQPFLFPAANDQEENVVNILAQAVINAFNNVLK